MAISVNQTRAHTCWIIISGDKRYKYRNWTCEDMIYAINCLLQTFLFVLAIYYFFNLLEFQWKRKVLLSLFYTAISTHWLDYSTIIAKQSYFDKISEKINTETNGSKNWWNLVKSTSVCLRVYFFRNFIKIWLFCNYCWII
jgi:hypothetical protein